MAKTLGQYLEELRQSCETVLSNNEFLTLEVKHALELIRVQANITAQNLQELEVSFLNPAPEVAKTQGTVSLIPVAYYLQESTDRFVSAKPVLLRYLDKGKNPTLSQEQQQYISFIIQSLDTLCEYLAGVKSELKLRAEAEFRSSLNLMKEVEALSNALLNEGLCLNSDAITTIHANTIRWQEVIYSIPAYEYLRNASFELRTPISSIRGYSDLLLMGILGELTPEQRSKIQRIRTLADDISNWLNANVFSPPKD